MFRYTHRILNVFMRFTVYNSLVFQYIVTYSLKARIMEWQQPDVTRQRPINNIALMFYARSVPMAVHAIMDYAMPSVSKNFAATELYFLRVPCRDVISMTSYPSSRQRGRPTSTNTHLSVSNTNLALGPRCVLHTKTDWQTDSRS
jgi:hypothetical protein